MPIFEELGNAVFAGKLSDVDTLVRKAIDDGVAPIDIINKGLMTGMGKVGVVFKSGEMFVPEVLMSAKVMNVGLDIVKPLISEGDIHNMGKIVIGTVRGDLHDIGKNLVAMMMESAGFSVIDLGIDVAPEKFVVAIKDHEPKIVALSALLTTTMGAIQETIEVLKEKGLRDATKVIIGGAPVTQKFANEIGADGYASDAVAAIDLVKKIIG